MYPVDVTDITFNLTSGQRTVNAAHELSGRHHFLLCGQNSCVPCLSNDHRPRTSVVAVPVGDLCTINESFLQPACIVPWSEMANSMPLRANPSTLSIGVLRRLDLALALVFDDFPFLHLPFSQYDMVKCHFVSGERLCVVVSSDHVNLFEFVSVAPLQWLGNAWVVDTNSMGRVNTRSLQKLMNATEEVLYQVRKVTKIALRSWLNSRDARLNPL